MTRTLESSRFPLPLHLLAAVAILAGPAGCSSMLNTTMLRDALVDAVDSPFDGGSFGGGASAAAAAAAARNDAAARTQPAKPSDPEAGAEEGVEDADDAASRQQQLSATLDTAIERLSRVGGLDDAARAALLSTLESTSPDDWPAVIDAFTSSLAAAPPRAEPQSPVEQVAAPAVSTTGVVASEDGGTGATAPPEAPKVPDEPVSDAGGLIFPVQPVAAAGPASPAPEATTGQSQLVVSNACFASRVRAWGVVDRFAADRFRPGQDVIVYFELDNVTASESAAGHTTIIDSALRLVDEDGRLVHEWHFDPIDETCPARRRDYFARYLVSIPESVPEGTFRLELAVTDVLGGRTAQTTIPLAVGGRLASGGLPDGVDSRR